MRARWGPERLDAVTFDFWNTMMWEGPDALVSARMRALGGLVEELGLEVDEERLLDAHAIAFDEYQSAWKANRQYCVPHAVDTILRELRLGDRADLHARFCRAFDDAGAVAELHLVDGLRATLLRLREAGIGLSIVCDIGLTPSSVLLRRLDDESLLPLFGSWAFSDEIGYYKPAPQLFDHALRGLGVSPDRAVHVGDRLRTDVGGAKAMGMGTVRYRGVYDDPANDGPEADVVLDDMARLPQILGIT